MPEFDAASLLQDATPDELAATIPQDEAADRVTASTAYLVVDQSETAIVGYIACPDDFCPLDSLASCEKDPDHRHLASFHNVDGWWVHMACGRPTKAWWESHLKSVVTFR